MCVQSGSDVVIWSSEVFQSDSHMVHSALTDGEMGMESQANVAPLLVASAEHDSEVVGPKLD